MAQDYLNYGFAYKSDLSDNLSVAVMYEQAYGAAVNYSNPAYPLNAALRTVFAAELAGTALSAVLRYEMEDGFSVHGGLRYVTMAGEIDFSTLGQKVTFGSSSDVGYLVGAAYEIPEIALRASVTYNSSTDHNNPITASRAPIPGIGPSAVETGAYSLPQSINLDLQTGVAEGTLVLASVRWAEWTKTAINTRTALGTIDYSNDVFTYSLGAARRLNEDLALLARVNFERATGGLASNIAPTDGQVGLSLAAIYDVGNARITGGVNYTWIGDATTDGVGATFTDNHALGLGVRIGVTF
jgi:long-subunit fatty acid transport protein